MRATQPIAKAIAPATQRAIRQHAAQAARAHASMASESCWLDGRAEAADEAERARHVALATPTAHGDAPVLPEPQGPQAPLKATLRCVSQPCLSESNTMFQVLQTMTQARQSDLQLSSLIKRMRNQAQMHAKLRELEAQGHEIHGKNRSATSRLIGSGLAIALSSLAAWRFKYQDQVIGQVISGAFDYGDRTIGGTAEANRASLDQSLERSIAQSEQMRVDSANNWYEQAKEGRKNAQQVLMTIIQQRLDRVNALWR